MLLLFHDFCYYTEFSFIMSLLTKILLSTYFLRDIVIDMNTKMKKKNKKKHYTQKKKILFYQLIVSV